MRFHDDERITAFEISQYLPRFDRTVQIHSTQFLAKSVVEHIIINGEVIPR